MTTNSNTSTNDTLSTLKDNASSFAQQSQITSSMGYKLAKSTTLFVADCVAGVAAAAAIVALNAAECAQQKVTTHVVAQADKFVFRTLLPKLIKPRVWKAYDAAFVYEALIATPAPYEFIGKEVVSVVLRSKYQQERFWYVVRVNDELAMHNLLCSVRQVFGSTMNVLSDKRIKL